MFQIVLNCMFFIFIPARSRQENHCVSLRHGARRCISSYFDSPQPFCHFFRIETGVITLRNENGQEAKLVPEHTKREMERQKSMEERSPERKKMEQGKEERKEEKKEVSKEQDRGREKDQDVFRERPEDRPERRQEKEREKKK